MYAADRINAGGGVKGLPIRVIARDTHSELERSRRAARELIEAGAVVVIGPESAEVAEAALLAAALRAGAAATHGTLALKLFDQA